MATTTNLRFDISTGWDGSGMDDADARIEALKKQIDDLSGKKVQITADTATADEEISKLKRQLDMLSSEDARVKLGIDDSTAEATIAKIQARLDALQDKRIQLQLDDADADLKLAAFKAEMDRISDKTVKLKADTSQLDRAFQDSKNKSEQAANDATQAWAKSSFAMQRASLNLFSAFMMLLPAIIPLGTAALGASGAIVSGFGSAGAAVGIFGLSLRSTLKSAMSIYTSTNQLNQTLAAQKQTLSTLTPGSAAYNSALIGIKQTQSQLNAAMAQGTPVQQEIAKSLLSLKDAWQSMQQQAEKFTGPLILNGLNGIRASLGFLPPVIKAVSAVFAPLIAQFDHFASDGGMQKFVNWVISVGVPNLKNLIATLQHIGITIVQIGAQFTTSGSAVTKWMSDITEKLDQWGAGGGFTRFQQSITAMWPKIKEFFDNFGQALSHVMTALNQLGPVSFSMLGLISKAAANLPIPVVQAFFVAFAGYKTIAAATGAITAIRASIASATAVMGAGKLALTAFKLGLEGVTLSSKDGTAALIANRVAIVSQAAASKIASAAQAVWTGITNAWKAATEGATLASIGQKIAAIASAVADGIATAAQIAWDAAIAVFEALTAPITLVILAIVAGVAAIGFAIYELVTHWTTVWHTIEQVAKDVWHFLTQGWGQLLLGFLGPLGIIIEVAAHWKEIWEGIKIAAQVVWAALQVAWRDVVNALKTAWDAVSSALKSTWDTVWNGVKTVALDVWNALKTAWNDFMNAVKAVWDTVSSAVKSAWNTVWNDIKTVALSIWDALKTAWNDFLNAVKSVWDSISSAFKSTWDTIWNDAKTLALTVWDALKTAWNDFLNAVKSVWDSISSAVKTSWDTIWTDIKTAALDVWNALKTAWDDFTGAIKSVWDTISSALKGAWDKLWSDLKGALNTFIADAKSIWATIKAAFEDPIKFVIDTVINGGILTAVNWVINHLGGHSSLKVPEPFAEGGAVSGPGTSTSDSIPAMLSDGEFVMNAGAVEWYGVDYMHQMNEKRLSLATGGFASSVHPKNYLAGGGQPISNADQNAINDTTPVSNVPASVAGGLSVSDIENIFVSLINAGIGAAAGVAGKALQVGDSALKKVESVPVVGKIVSFFAGPAQSLDEQISGALLSFGQKDFDNAAQKIIDLITSKLLPSTPNNGNPQGDIGHGATMGAAKQFLENIKTTMSNFLFGQQKKEAASFAVAGVIPTGEHAAIIQAALQADGVPIDQWGAWEAGMNTLIGRESGWNASAVNNYDSNAAAGTPSEGLAQVIAPTFAAYRNPALPNNLLDPVANVAAAINYINRVYGGIGFVQQANANLPAKGYDVGGVLGTGYTLAYNATGVPEGVLNPTGLAGIGGFTGLSALNSGQYTYTGSTLNGSGQPVVVNVTNNWYGNPDKEAVEYAEHDMADELTKAVIAGVGSRTT